jgi:predicted enzyme related to lactoylglutathione lyase
MKFINVRLMVDHFAESIHFWQDLMGFQLKYRDEGMGYAYFETGSAGVELVSRTGSLAAAEEVMPAGGQTIMVFQVDNLDATYADLVQRGAVSVSKPQDYPAIQIRTARINDPEGNLIEIYSPLATSGSSNA